MGALSKAKRPSPPMTASGRALLPIGEPDTRFELDLTPRAGARPDLDDGAADRLSTRCVQLDDRTRPLTEADGGQICRRRARDDGRDAGETAGRPSKTTGPSPRAPPLPLPPRTCRRKSSTSPSASG